MSCPDPTTSIGGDIAALTVPSYRRRPHENQGDICQVGERILALMAGLQIERMPTEQELLTNGERGLLIAILHQGGLRAVAARMGVPYALRKPRGYWALFDHVEWEFRRFVAKYDLKTMPTEKQLELAGRRDLLMAVKKYGGLRAVAGRMGIPANPVGRPRKSTRAS